MIQLPVGIQKNQKSEAMDRKIILQVNDRPDAQSICDLREAVGWERLESDYPTVLEHYDTTVAAYDDEILVGWCAVLSDSIRHGFFVDVIVHPDWQRRGIGRSIVRKAAEQLLNRGITIIHADFSHENALFYERCGFRIGSGGEYKP
jgi:GNAT superfamily N-acetyltransferase